MDKSSRLLYSSPKVATLRFGLGLDDDEHAKQSDFTVHLALLCEHSDFFKNALTGSFQEAETGLVDLPDTPKWVGYTFQHWLYCQKLEVLTLGVGNDQSDKWSSDVDQTECVTLYAFCDKYQVNQLGRVVMDTLISQLRSERCGVDEDCLVAAEGHFSEDSPVVRLLTDVIACDGLAGYTVVLKNLRPAVAQQLLVKCVQHREAKATCVNCPWFRGKRCAYHFHRDEAEKKKCQEATRATKKRNYGSV